MSHRDVAQAYMNMVRRAPPQARAQMLTTLKRNANRFAYSPKKFEKMILARVQAGIPRRSVIGRKIQTKKLAKLRATQRRIKKASPIPASLNKLLASIKL